MIVSLPREYAGQEIIDAFITASTIGCGSQEKWMGKEFWSLQLRRSGIRRTLGVKVSPYMLQKKFIFFGPLIWAQRGNPTFTLKPLLVAGSYREVDVGFSYIYHVKDEDRGDPLLDGDSGVGWTTNPTVPAFNEIRPTYDGIISRFVDELKK